MTAAMSSSRGQPRAAMLSDTAHRHWRPLLSSLLLAMALGVLVYISNQSLGVAAVIAVAGLTATTAFQGTLQNWIASAQLSSEGYVHHGTILTVIGPNGPVTGRVIDRELRITVLESTDGAVITVVPNMLLTASPYLVLRDGPSVEVNTGADCETNA